MTHWEAETLVIGGGPAGMAAASTAAVRGRSVLLLDDNPGTGGQIWRKGIDGAQESGDRVQARTLQAFETSGVRFEAGCRVFDRGGGKSLRVLRENSRGQQVVEVRYCQLVLATGARELMLPFPGWTLPGVFGAGGLQALAKGGFSVRGKRVVIAGTGPLLLAVAAHLQQAGALVHTVAEQASLAQLLPFASAPTLAPGKLLQGLRYRLATRNTRYRNGCWPVAALGHDHLSAVRLTDGRTTWDVPCDLLACGFHLVPNTELAALLGCELAGARVVVDSTQQTSVAGIYCAGEPTGIAGLDAALAQGRVAGLACSGAPAAARRAAAAAARQRRFAARLNHAYRLRPELGQLAEASTIVCRCEDVTKGQLQPYGSWTEAKATNPVRHGSLPGPHLRAGDPGPFRVAAWFCASAAFACAPLGVLQPGGRRRNRRGTETLIRFP